MTMRGIANLKWVIFLSVYVFSTVDAQSKFNVFQNVVFKATSLLATYNTTNIRECAALCERGHTCEAATFDTTAFQGKHGCELIVNIDDWTLEAAMNGRVIVRKTAFDECTSSPCQNDGTCRNGIHSYSCTCPAGYTGSSCEREINECDSSPCLHGGTCEDGLNSVTCICTVDYVGYFCQTNVCGGNPSDRVKCPGRWKTAQQCRDLGCCVDRDNRIASWCYKKLT